MKSILSVLLISALIIFHSNHNLSKQGDEYSYLKKCQADFGYSKNSTECFKNYFERYTAYNGREQAIENYQQLVKKDSTFVENCHYVMHGIGHGTLEYFNMDINKSFAISMASSTLGSLPPTCGNGYFHGLIEQYIGDSTDLKVLKEKLSNVCESKSVSDFQNKVDCYHGIGHGVYIQLNYDIQKAINFCEQNISDEKMQSMCRTGIFMEMLRQSDGMGDTDKIMTFSACENLEKKYQGECFNQQSYFLEEFGTKKKEFNANLDVCDRKFPSNKNTLDRVTCIRMFKF